MFRKSKISTPAEDAVEVTSAAAAPAKKIRPPMPSAAEALSHHGRTAILLIAVFGGSFSAWSVTFDIEGAVVAPGVIAVEHNIKKIQHPTGGVVRELLVVEGQMVKEGDVLVRLDDTVTRANLGIVVNDLTAQRARVARLQAERDGAEQPVFPDDLVARAATDKDVASVIEGERSVFNSRATTRRGQKQQLTERIGQSREEIRGAEEQLVATRNQTVLAKDELKDLDKLWRKGLVPRTRVSQLEREIMRNEGLQGELLARVAQSQGKITETEVQITQLDRDLAAEVAKDIRETETKINELNERRLTAEDQFRRIEIKAPISGAVFQLAVHTVGGVISPSEPAMMIVPEGDRLIVEAKINPTDIDRVAVGQQTMIRLSAFNGHTTPQVAGVVTRVSGDLVKEQQTQQSYFTAGITISDEEIKKLRGLKLLPGMPAESYIKTAPRTFANYLTKPIRDQFHRALRED